MTLKRICFIFLVISLLLNSRQNNISYSSKKNIELISETKISNNNDSDEKLDKELPKKEEINIEKLIKECDDNYQENNEIIDEAVKEKIEINEFDVNGLQLREGISSDEVLRLKRFLFKIGYGGLQEDYYFDKENKKIVLDYQRLNNLNPDGIIGPKTFSLINEDMKRNQISLPKIEIALPKLVPESKWILINKESNTLYHFENRELIKKYPIASGKTPRHTPEGKFTIIRKFINPAWGGAGRYTPVRGGSPNNPLGKRWLGLSIGGGGTYGIHGNADAYSIGKHVSLGCIRMFNADIELLFDLVEYHTPVWIFGSMPEFVHDLVISEEAEDGKIQK